MSVTLLRILFIVVLMALVRPVAVRAAEDDLQVLHMFYDDADLVPAVTRNSTPLSAVAETITIISSQDIEAMNAHTADELLEKIAGVQRELRGGPGNAMFVTIRGGDFNQVRVLLDGATINSVSSSYADLSIIPAHIIDHIEVLKGPASSTWGSALGGVINIVTKEPEGGRAGTVYLSGGEAGFRDLHGEHSATGRSGGYYLFAGNLGFDGLVKNAGTDLFTFFGKGTWQPDLKTDVAASVFIADGSRHSGEGLRDDSDPQRLYGHVTARRTLSDRLALESTVRFLRVKDDFNRDGYTMFGSESSVGGSVVANWTNETHAVAAGVDFDNGQMKYRLVPAALGAPMRDHINKIGFFLSDTVTIGRFSVTPSIRYDWNNRMTTGVTCNLGAAWRVTDGTIIRVTGARGYSLPQITGAGDDRAQRVLSFQAGVETADIPFLWLRGTFFYSRLSDVPVYQVGLTRQHATGGEAELKTVPVFNTSLSAGFMFLTAENSGTGKRVPRVPTHTWNLGLRYDDEHGFKGSLLGHYVWWNGESEFRGRYDDFIWDLNLSRRLAFRKTFAPEIFFTLHNVLDGRQYVYSMFKNTGRWAEGGIRFSF